MEFELSDDERIGSVGLDESVTDETRLVLGDQVPNFKHRAQIVPRHVRGRVDADKPLAPMTWAQRLKRVFSIDIEISPDCGGTLRVIACTRHGFTRALLGLRPNRTLVLACAEEPALIAGILGHVQQRLESDNHLARAPPGHQEPTFNLIGGSFSCAVCHTTGPDIEVSWHALDWALPN